MKQLLAMTFLSLVAMSTVTLSAIRHSQAERPVDEAAVNAKVDARLKQVLGELRQKVASGQELAIAGR